MINNTITCERDESSPSSNNAASYAFTDTLVNLTQLYSNLQTQINYAYGSDYVPFQEAGKVITGLYETNESSFVHSPNDILSRMSPVYVTQVARASTGAALYFSGTYQLNALNNLQEKVTARIYPNPAGDLVKWKFTEKRPGYLLRILDEKGSCISEKQYSGDDPCMADISYVGPGVLALQFIFADGYTTTVKILKSH